ncbi:MAG: hypothetical protein UT48_C0037G0006 [Parcubacteria group bacterium GW2011_GWE2_39_37]|uniref:Transposase IS200-like domain-containing protein n=1 Tax=Candidatus Falkowbacteria bacterium GW2011_GWF2_39_8 TaxID=1618642 RepID=A0A0G0PXN1_9BACT|nr:MAG: hypothetical protein UT48_C0037G0006 [Parcubacteria group bacterium GW2011_GWE2_39_37]KKR32874.1 MAG: hypothetical protein UT64_C0020G0009 [Candidatus Falkowbacteria bacterium GW2011_GWF2_39_8]
MRKFEFQTDEYYHIYNRGVDKRQIFVDENDFIRFLTGMREFNIEKSIGSLRTLQALSACSCRHLEPGESTSLVNIICYCLNKNHFHFILKQQIENGITKFMHKISMGYTNYFNLKHERSGSLFQGPFKAVHINTNDYLLWLSGYINGNCQIHGLGDAKNYPWSSYKDYLYLRNGTLCDKKPILEQFKGLNEYEKFVEMIVNDSSERKEEYKKYLLE